MPHNGECIRGLFRCDCRAGDEKTAENNGTQKQKFAVEKQRLIAVYRHSLYGAKFCFDRYVFIYLTDRV